VELNVAQLLKEPTGSTREVHVDETICFTGNEDCHHIEGDAKLIRVPKGILVRGHFDTESQLMCSRCLSTFAFPFAFEVDDEFYPALDIVTGEPVAEPDNSTSFSIDEHHILDLRELFRQSALLGVPMKPLCRPDCLGLCPICGTDLNRGTCDCSSHSKTQFAAALENLKSTRKMG